MNFYMYIKGLISLCWTLLNVFILLKSVMYLCTVRNDSLLKNFVTLLQFYFYHSPKRLEGQIWLLPTFCGRWDRHHWITCVIYTQLLEEEGLNLRTQHSTDPWTCSGFFCRGFETEFMFWLKPALLSIRDLSGWGEAWRLGTGEPIQITCAEL